MSLTRTIAPLSVTSASASLPATSNLKKNMNSNALRLEGAKERIKKMFNKVELSISSYDTAWVAMIPSMNSPNVPFFPECLNWLLENQQFDGSWGLPGRHPLLFKDALLSTLACVLALKQWDVGEEQTIRGLQFIESNIASVIDEKQHSPIGFDVIFPSLLKSAQSLGINLCLGSTSLEGLIHNRELELRRGYQSNSDGWRAYLAYVSEGIGKNQDWQMVMKYQRKNGSLFNSPATTAAVFQHYKNDDCLIYLRSVLEQFGNAVPTVYPLDIYARLCMVDSLERLGIDYHFSKEIQSVLDETYRYWIDGDEEIFLDPTCCALAFRLLRMNGYDVSSDPFNQYSKDKFPDSLKGYLKDVGAVLELYKASQIMIHPGEEVLVKQNAWTRHLLKQELSPFQVRVDRLFSHVEQEVNDELKFPHHKKLERLLNRASIDHYNLEDTRILKTSYRSLNLANEDFLKMAAEDFNICQSIHHEEFKQLARWVVDSRLDKLKFARQKLGYCYFTSAATIFYPELSDARIAWAKNGVLTTVVDDFFDVGGSEEELVQLIRLVERWDVDLSSVSCSESVSIIFSAVRDTICEIGENSLKCQEHNATDHVKKIWLDLMRSMLKEAQWSKNKHVPTIDEYMENAYVSFALGPIVLPTLYLVGHKLPTDLAENPEYHRLYELMSTSGRLLNDFNGYKRESAQGKLNAFTLLVAQRGGDVAEEDVIQEMKDVIEENRRELLRLVLQEEGSTIPRACKDLFWKMAKVLYLFYLKDDGFTSHELSSTVSDVLEKPVVLHEFSEAEAMENLNPVST
ncbi:ent-kaurene synthase, chloroplastic isoform X2 [Prosopis cineraria]|uniref:ent-kaurene synthase, chloroplastic isoform X2 n=1 Tax=Prosopis cineraria TaxID=364024 RepID=UPI00240FD832|nr:ent-kaurene synthase, chloroplastic isoform X2 [Prosopis cineraria]